MKRRLVALAIAVLAAAGCTFPRSHAGHHGGHGVHVEICPPYCAAGSDLSAGKVPA